MRKVVSFVIVIMSAMVSVSAQTGENRKQYLDNKVILAVDKVANPEGTSNSFTSTSFSYPVDEFKPGVVQVGPRITYLKEGLSTEEVVRLLGKPSTISKRTDAGVVVTVYEFQRGEGRVLVAEFVKNLLVHSAMEKRGQVARADR